MAATFKCCRPFRRQAAPKTDYYKECWQPSAALLLTVDQFVDRALTPVGTTARGRPILAAFLICTARFDLVTMRWLRLLFDNATHVLAAPFSLLRRVTARQRAHREPSANVGAGGLRRRELLLHVNSIIPPPVAGDR